MPNAAKLSGQTKIEVIELRHGLAAEVHLKPPPPPVAYPPPWAQQPYNPYRTRN